MQVTLPTVVVEPIDIPMEDEIIHTIDHPFCDNMECPCNDMYGPSSLEYIHIPLDEGLLTLTEARRLWDNENI